MIVLFVCSVVVCANKRKLRIVYTQNKRMELLNKCLLFKTSEIQNFICNNTK